MAIPSSDPLAQKVMTISSNDYRMRHGFCIPIHGLSGYQAGISFAGFDVDDAKEANAALQLIGIYAFNRLANLKSVCKEHGILTDREREVLRWTAAGKTAWDTGGILNITEDTVNKHIASAMRKLNVIRAPRRWLNRSVAAKSFPDCQFRFLGIAKIILKTNDLRTRRMRRPMDRPELQALRGAVGRKCP